MSTGENKAMARRYNERNYIASPRLGSVQVGDKFGYINKTGDYGWEAFE